jgi:hypothetical protein
MKKYIGSGLKITPIDMRKEYVFKYSDGTHLHIPKECCTRTGQLKAGVTKAILLRDYSKLQAKGVIIRHLKKGA